MPVARNLVLLVGLFACATQSAESPRPQQATVLKEMHEMMTRAAAAWNRGDLDAFMSDYYPGTVTTYIGRRGIVRGPDSIKAVYAPRFAPGGVRDSLSFEGIEVDILGPDVINTIAWYVLARGDSVVARGPTSRVMRKTPTGWKIVHEHTS
jgi:ketosteroid isomerase-like protein